MNKVKRWLISYDVSPAELYGAVVLVGGIIFIGGQAHIWAVPTWGYAVIFFAWAVGFVLALFFDA